MNDVLGNLGQGFAAVLTLEGMFFVLVGVFVGTVVGILPGLGSITAVALLIPVAFGIDPLSGLIMLCGVYFGSQYGSSTTAILVRTPGDMGSIVTTIDGYEMARQGRAGPALATAAIGSFLAGTVSILGLTFLSPWLARVAISLGAAEYFLLMLLALLLVATLTTGSTVKAIISALVGLALSTIGLQDSTGVPRLTFGSLELSSGIDFVLVAIALFAIGEAARILGRKGGQDEVLPTGKIGMTKEDWRRSAAPWARGSIIGFIIGVLPGIGPSLASYLSYIAEKYFIPRRYRSQFGRGAIEGVAGPEAANNAGVGGSMVPIFTLGIPGSATTALLLFVFTMYGMQPGPNLFSNNPEIVYGIIASLYIGNVALLVLNLPMVPLFTRLLTIPTPVLYFGVMAFAVLGVYASRLSQFDLLLLVGFGVVGYLMMKFDFPPATLILAMVLGPLVEDNLGRALNISRGDLTVFIDRPISRVLVICGLVVVLAPIVARLVGLIVMRSREASRKREASAHPAVAVSLDAPDDAGTPGARAVANVETSTSGTEG